MPYDADGNLSTPVSAPVKTLKDVMDENSVDAIPLFKAGVALVADQTTSGTHTELAVKP